MRRHSEEEMNGVLTELVTVKLSPTSAHADLEYMQEIRSELGSITHTLQSLHKVIEHDDDNIGKYIHALLPTCVV